MSAIRHLKNNLLVRNCWMIVTRAKNLFRGKKQFAKCADNVIITPPPTHTLTHTPPPPTPILLIMPKTFVLGRMYA